MEKNISKKRWEIAQKFEEAFWNGFTTESLEDANKKIFLKKLQIYSVLWKRNIKLNKNSKILCIGCGPLDIINYLKNYKKYSIDPLADFFRKKFNFDYDSQRLIKGVGENLPYKDNFFDLVIVRNVLDHTNSSSKVLSEIKRVLKKQGLVHLEVHFYQKKFLKLAKIWSTIKKFFTGKVFNPNHPHMFSLNGLRNFISEKFNIVHEEIGKDFGIYENIRDLKKLMSKEKLTMKILVYLGFLGPINYLGILKNKNINLVKNNEKR